MAAEHARLLTRDLVILFVTACGLSKQQVSEVAALWDELDAMPAKTPEALPADVSEEPPAAERSVIEVDVKPVGSGMRPLLPVPNRAPAIRPGVVAVVMAALRSEGTNRRALRLLWPLAVVTSVLIAGLTVIAIVIPGAAQALGLFFAAVIGLLVIGRVTTSSIKG